MKDWQFPAFGPYLHGIVVFLLADGWPVVAYIQQTIAEGQATFDLNRFAWGLAAALATALVSWARNYNKTVVYPLQPAATAGTAPDILPGDAVVLVK